ncbi:MAG: TonB-dependent receptor [Bacteroidaceae bacterium]|nr:TonB-dependent receptor [Bacteroidaceae bacterium]
MEGKKFCLRFQREVLLLSCLLAAVCGKVSAREAEEADTASIVLQHQLTDLIVTGTREEVDATHVTRTVSTIDRSQLTQQHRPSILPTLGELVPGLFVTSRGVFGYGVSNGAAGGINVRGMGSGEGRVLVLIDGKPQYQGIYGHSIADAYQTMMAERVEVVRGPSSALYGSNAMGGVVNIITRGKKDDGVATEAHLSMGSHRSMMGEICNQVRHKWFTSSVGGQYLRTDNHRENMGFEQYGGFLKLGFEIGSHWTASAGGNVTHFNASNPGPESAPLLSCDQWVTRGVADITFANDYGNTKGGISVYDNFGWHKIDDGYRQGASPQTSYFNSKDVVAGVSAWQTVQFFEGNHTTFGFDYQRIMGRTFYTGKESGEELPSNPMTCADRTFNDLAGYVDFRQDIGARVTLDAALRYDHHSQVGGEWVPQGGVAYRPIANGELKATVSKGYRVPTLKEMFLYKTRNDALRPERLMNYELAWQHRLLEGRLRYGANVFYQQADNLIQNVTPTLATSQYVNTGEVKMYGMEAEAAWTINPHWSLTTNHTVLGTDKPMLATPTYKGYVGVDMQYNRWSANVGFQQLVGVCTDVSNDTRSNASLLSATVSYWFRPVAQIYLRGENLLAQRYEVMAGYPMPRALCMAGVKVKF